MIGMSILGYRGISRRFDFEALHALPTTYDESIHTLTDFMLARKLEMSCRNHMEEKIVCSLVSKDFPRLIHRYYSYRIGKIDGGCNSQSKHRHCPKTNQF